MDPNVGIMLEKSISSMVADCLLKLDDDGKVFLEKIGKDLGKVKEADLNNLIDQSKPQLFDVREMRVFIIMKMKEKGLEGLDLLTAIVVLTQNGANISKIISRLPENDLKKRFVDFTSKLDVRMKLGGLKDPKMITASRLLISFEDAQMILIIRTKALYMGESTPLRKALIHPACATLAVKANVEKATKYRCIGYHLVLSYNFWRRIKTSNASKEPFDLWLQGQIPFLQTKLTGNIEPYADTIEIFSKTVFNNSKSITNQNELDPLIVSVGGHTYQDFIAMLKSLLPLPE